MNFRIAQLYPELLSQYADRGNMLVLQKIAAKLGLNVTIIRIPIGDRFRSEEYDIVVAGGGQDRDQEVVSRHLQEQRSAIKDFVEAGRPFLAICGSYQLMGHEYVFGIGRERRGIRGIGLLDMVTTTEQPRLIGRIEVSISYHSGEYRKQFRTLVGFENHAGRTTLGESVVPLGRVVVGHGNDGRSGFEGARWLNLIGTYIHGPLLPRNIWLAHEILRVSQTRELLTWGK